MPDRRRRITLAVCLVGWLALAATGCARSDGPASAVGSGPGGTTIHFKPCDDTSAIERLRLLDPRNRIVWTATLAPGGAARTDLRVATDVPGYRVVDGLGAGGLHRGTTYRAVAESTSGATWTGPTFDPSDLRHGEVRAAGKRVDTSTWLAGKASCGHRSAARVAVSALLAGAVAAGLIGVVLGPLWLLRRAALRHAREREGHLPWLHDPPPAPSPRPWRVRRRTRDHRH